MKLFKKYVLVISIFLFSISAFGQPRWTEWKNVYQEGLNVAQISFKINGCGSGSTPNVVNSYWRGRNTFTRRGASVTGKIVYRRCTGELQSTTFRISLEKPFEDPNEGDWGKLFLGAKHVEEIIDVEIWDPYREKGNSNIGTNDKSFGSMPNFTNENNRIGNRDDAERAKLERQRVQQRIREAETARQQAREKAKSEREERLELEQERLAREAEDKARRERELQENFNDLQNQLNEDQQARDELSAESTANIASSAGLLGALIFNDVGPEFDRPKNKFRKGSWRFTINFGYSAALFPAYVNRTSNIATITTTTSTTSTIAGLPGAPGLEGALRFWPFYSKHFGFSLGGQATGAMLPISGHTLLYDYNYGVKAFLGSGPVKLLAEYSMGDRGLDHVRNYSLAVSNLGSENQNLAVGATFYSRIGFGPRISFSTYTSLGNLELLYVMEDYENLKRISGHGLQVNYYAHNRIRVSAEVLFSAARIGIISHALEAGTQNTGSIYKLSVTRSWDSFGQPKR